MEYLHHLIRHVAVYVEPWHREDKVRAFAQSGHRWHRGMNAVFACLVTGGSHHTPLFTVPHGNRLPTVFGVITLFDGRVKRVNIDMEIGRANALTTVTCANHMKIFAIDMKIGRAHV